MDAKDLEWILFEIFPYKRRARLRRVQETPRSAQRSRVIPIKYLNRHLNDDPDFMRDSFAHFPERFAISSCY